MADIWNMIGVVFDSSTSEKTTDVAPEPKPLAGDKDLYDQLKGLQDLVQDMKSTLITVNISELTKSYNYGHLADSCAKYCRLDGNVIVGLSTMIEDYLSALNRTEVQFHNKLEYRNDLRDLNTAISHVKRIWRKKFNIEWDGMCVDSDELAGEIAGLKIKLREAEARKILKDSSLDIFRGIRTKWRMNLNKKDN